MTGPTLTQACAQIANLQHSVSQSRLNAVHIATEIGTRKRQGASEADIASLQHVHGECMAFHAEARIVLGTVTKAFAGMLAEYPAANDESALA